MSIYDDVLDAVGELSHRYCDPINRYKIVLSKPFYEELKALNAEVKSKQISPTTFFGYIFEVDDVTEIPWKLKLRKQEGVTK